MTKAFKTELHVTDEQAKKLLRGMGVCRWLYNYYIARNKELYEKYQRGELDPSEKHFVSANDFDKYINHDVKTKDEYSWINNCGSKARKKAIVNAENAFKRFFKGEAGFPQFKKRDRHDVTLYFPKNNPTDWTIERHRVKIPTLGFVRLKEFDYLPVGAKVISGTVSYEAGRFFVSVIVEINEKRKNILPFSDGIGVDLGIHELAIISDGRKIKNINKEEKIKKLEKRLRRAQRSLSRMLRDKKKRGGKTATYSANIEKQKRIVQKLHRRLKNIREDHENKAICELIKRNPSYITIEDLNVRGMMKNRHLAKAVAGQRFYSLINKLKIKAKELGIEIRVVSRFYPSSKTCHACGHIKADLKLSERIYICSECGNRMDRDVNAALNLRDAKEYTIA